MINRDITLGQYFPGNTPVHRADPRTKIIITVMYMTAVFLIKSYTAYAAACLFILSVVFVSGITFKYVFKGLKPIFIIIVFTAIINILFTGGQPVFSAGFLHITREGITIAVQVVLRLTLLIVGASLLTFTTTPLALTDGIEKIFNPFKKLGAPVHEIAMMMVIALKFIPILLEETDKIMKAQASRGADFESGNILARAKSFVPVLVPLFISAFKRADDLAIAMEARCYRGGEGRTRIRKLRFGRVDLYVFAYFTGFAAAGFLLNLSF